MEDENSLTKPGAQPRIWLEKAFPMGPTQVCFVPRSRTFGLCPACHCHLLKPRQSPKLQFAVREPER